MRFLPTLLAVVGAASAATSAQKPYEVIIEEIKLIQNATARLTSEINNFQNLTQAVTLLAANTNVLSTVNNGTQRILAIQQQVSLDDVLKLTPPVIQLRALVNQSISAVIAKKSIFVNQSIGALTYQSLQQQNCASEQFNNATNSRLPGGGIGAASKALSAPIFTSFDMGLAAYKDQSSNTTAAPNCTYVNGTSRGLTPADQASVNGAGIVGSSSGVAFALAAAIALFVTI